MHRLRMIAAGMLLAAAAFFAAAAPASAHDQLISSTPQAGERLASPPATITLTFSDELLVIGDLGATVLVVDGDDRDWAVGVSVDGPTVTVAVDEGMPEAGYEVRWRVVSSDGHPISGVVPFTIGDGEALSKSASPSASTPASESGAGAGTGTADGTVRATPTGIPDGLRVVITGVIGALFALAVLLLIRIANRRSRAADTPDAP